MPQPTNATSQIDLHPTLHGFHFNVKAFGAVGDGSADDTTAVQAAVNAVSSGGGTVHFPPGTYMIGSAIAVGQNGTVLRGAGKSASIIRRKNTSNAYMVTLTGKTDCLIEHLKFDANDGNQSSNYENIRLDAASHNLTVQHCAFTDTKGFNVFTVGGPSSRVNNLRILDNDVTQRTGGVQDILVPVTSGGMVARNRISVQGGVGIVLYESDDINCTGNYIILNAIPGVGIRVESCRFASIVGNNIVVAANDVGIQVMKETDNGVSARDAVDTYLLGNTIRATSTTGTIAFKLTDNAQRVTIQGNGAEFCSSFVTYNSGTLTDILIADNRASSCTVFDTYTVTPTNIRYRDNVTGNSLDIASATTITLGTHSDYFNITGTTTITSVTASWPGRQVTLKFAGILTFTDGSNLKLATNFVTTADDTITLVCDGTNWFEVARSVN